MNDTNGVFHNPLTLELFLHCKNQPNPVGIRETQRALGISSPSSVHWHFNKLIDMGLLERLKNNRFALTEEGKKLRILHVPINFPFVIIKGHLVTMSIFQIAFLIFAILFGVLLSISNPVALNVFFFLVLLVEMGIALRFYRLIQGSSRIS